MESESTVMSDSIISDFKMKAPAFYLDRIKTFTTIDPLLKQILPRYEEVDDDDGYVIDPTGDEKYHILPGVIHKYKNRILIIASSSCAIHCRYCFRRHYSYDKNKWHDEMLDNTINYINNNTHIDEVIFSGGDFLTSSNARLKKILVRMDEETKVNIIRIHTRTLTVMPDRLDETLENIFFHLKKKVVIVLHVNHPDELDSQIQNMIIRLGHAGVVIYNQSVLLKDVNDSAIVQVALCKKLFSYGIQPYYLNLLDKVKGSQLFYVPKATALEIYTEMASQLSGYMMPKLVSDEDDLPYKKMMQIKGS